MHKGEKFNALGESRAEIINAISVSEALLAQLEGVWDGMPGISSGKNRDLEPKMMEDIDYIKRRIEALRNRLGEKHLDSSYVLETDEKH